MTKNTPLARGVRTFMLLLASSGAMAALLQTDWFEDWRTGAVTIGIAVLSALVGGISAFALAQSAWWQANVTSPVYKAGATALQQLGAALGSITIVNLTSDALADVGQMVVNFCVAAVLAFGLAFAQNAAEDAGQPAEPAG